MLTDRISSPVWGERKTRPMAKDTSNANENAELPELPASGPGIATPEENAALTHSDPNAPETTRDDMLDAGVPMLPGSPTERQGPEDALGIGPKRGDYTTRVGPSDYNPHVSVRDPETGRSRLVSQRGLAEDIGDAPGKGGVDTDPYHPHIVPAAAPMPQAGNTPFMNRELGLNEDGSPMATPDASTAPRTATTRETVVTPAATREGTVEADTAPTRTDAAGGSQAGTLGAEVKKADRAADNMGKGDRS